MPRRKKEVTKADQLLDELLQDYVGPEQILGEGGLLSCALSIWRVLAK